MRITGLQACFNGLMGSNILPGMNLPILIPPIQHSSTTKKPLSPSQRKQENSLTQKTKQPHNHPWDGKILRVPSPQRTKKNYAGAIFSTKIITIIGYVQIPACHCVSSVSQAVPIFDTQNS
jgi:hypothetical protein